jgi:hypothetical protein
MWLIRETNARDAFSRDAASFVETPCSSVKTTVVAYTRRDNTVSYYSPRLECTYSVDGSTYSVDSKQSKLDFSRWSTKEDARAEATHYLRSVTPHAYYDPDDPERGAMSRNVESAGGGIVFPMVMFAPVAVGFVVFFLIRLGLFVRARRQARLAGEDFPSARVVHEE